MTIINEWDKDTIENKIIELKKELINYKIKRATRQDVKAHYLKNLKYQIAKILTIKTQIEKNQNATKRNIRNCD